MGDERELQTQGLSKVVVHIGAPLDADTVAGATALAQTAAVTLTDVPIATWLARIGLGLLLSLAVLTVLYLLYRFMRSIDAGTPFTIANVRRLQIMAGIMLLGPVLAFWIQTFWNGHLLALAFGIEHTWAGRFDNLYIAICGFGTLLACIAGVFRQGLILEDDVEGLV